MATEKCKEALFIVSTYYHTLISCMKQLIDKKSADIMITDYIPNGENLSARVESERLFDNVFFVNKVIEYQHKGKIDYILHQHKRNPSCIDVFLPISFAQYTDIYIFHDDIWAAHYCKDKRISYHLIEDSLDFFQHISKTSYRYMLPNPRWKCWIRRLLRIGYVSVGFDSCTIDIEVNDVRGVEIAPFARGKLVEIPRKKLWALLKSSDIEVLIRLFCVGNIPHNTLQYVLLLTRVLFEEGLVCSEEEQLNAHKELIATNGISFSNLIIKPHPRDCTDYAKEFPGAIVLDKNMPAEMLHFVCPEGFKKVVAFHTTEIQGVT